jgi:hypothetical protein
VVRPRSESVAAAQPEADPAGSVCDWVDVKCGEALGQLNMQLYTALAGKRGAKCFRAGDGMVTGSYLERLGGQQKSQKWKDSVHVL